MKAKPSYEELERRFQELKADHAQLENKLLEARSLTEEIMTYMPEGLVLIDTRETIVFINQRLSEILGYLPGEIIGKCWLDIVPQEQQAIAKEGLARLFLGYTDRYEMTLHHKNGEKFPVLIGAGPRVDKQSGEFIGSVGIVRDITERKQIEQEREKLQVQLTQVQKMEAIGTLAGGIAHDFNNMLGVILGRAELGLKKTVPTDPVYKDLEQIHNTAGRSAEITRQLLAFARKQTISPRVIDLNSTVGNMIKMLSRLIGEDIDLRWQPAGNLWSVKIDPSQLDQILVNLCVNARDAITDVGKITLETGMKVFDPDYCKRHAGFVPGKFVLLAVSDDGRGMDRHTLDNLFEPFFTTKETGRGTGLGLATVYGIVKQNNGFINVYSEPGKGSSFQIYLPCHTADLPGTLPEKPVSPMPRGSGETLLVVEDEDTILDMLEEMLKSLNYTVLAADSPSRAMTLAQSHNSRIHMVITDVVMPEMNGRDLAGKLSALYPDIKILFMSGYTANVIAHQGVLDQGVNFLQKPFSMDNLAEKLREVLDS